jgi:hypothetical protein
MTENEIIQRLSEGWILANRGTGWFLSEPMIAYRRTESLKVDDAMVNEMEAKGLIITALPYKTIFAHLVVEI